MSFPVCLPGYEPGTSLLSEMRRHATPLFLLIDHGRSEGSLTPKEHSGRLKGAVDRELGGEYIGHFPQFSDVYHFCATTIFLVRFLRIRPVQSVANNPKQLSGRGFPCIFYMQLCLSQLYILLVLQHVSRAI